MLFIAIIAVAGKRADIIDTGGVCLTDIGRVAFVHIDAFDSITAGDEAGLAGTGKRADCIRANGLVSGDNLTPIIVIFATLVNINTGVAIGCEAQVAITLRTRVRNRFEIFRIDQSLH